MVSTIHMSPPPLSPQSMADLLCTLVILCRGQDIYGQDFWAYMCIKPSMAEAFKQARDGGNFTLGDYGTILEAGDGHEVPDDIKVLMERDYGISHDYEDKLLKAIADNKRRNSA